ncbi:MULTISPECIES: type II secretion system protein [Peptoniphilus]|jgi:hypothetical protein|uniref:type II secretion system protein n=1 Tax=Peptoniphilus TaxID=162289 RepID=UPI0002884F8C|nr:MULTISPECIES: type II secretion system protein [Peptoniphilus]MBS6610622.1 type II secretion system protein [Peptoniphilus harei]MDU1044015.1 type II secretion system protein [Peptoniphilus rhinitidis]MDU1954630.1 type II secretion system protein [Peptoniphilus lacydonensis]MDU2109868.1 type II secretion system protein [Peptoniphilus lacydonensis]MDU2115778.1 type II secretion system protein [Peptoniphilus lacydonensis]
MKLKNKNRGHLMIEVLFSIALIGIIASIILPNIISLLENQNYLKEREMLVNEVFSKMEDIIGEAYNNSDSKDLDFHVTRDGNSDFIINVDNNKVGNLNHIVVSGKRRDSDEEIEFEVYLSQKGLYSY